jgi:lipoprotein NlpI
LSEDCFKTYRTIEDTNDLKLARRLFNASLAFDASLPEVWDYLGDVSVQESQLNKNNSNNDKLMTAIYYYNKAIELDSMNNLFYYERANCYYSIGDTAYLSDYRKSCNLGNSKACIVIK